MAGPEDARKLDATRETQELPANHSWKKTIVGSSTGFSAHILVHRQRAVVERVNEPKSAPSSIGPPQKKFDVLQIKSYPKAPDPVAFGSSCSGLNHLPLVVDLVGPGQSSLTPLLLRCRCLRTSFP